MKEEKMKKEPAIADVLDAIQKSSGRLDSLEVAAQDIAEAMQTGFAKVEERFEKVDARFDGTDSRLDSMNNRLTYLEKGQTETHRHLDSLEKKQTGMLESLDETVHQNEFRKLAHRVERLEVKA